MLVDEWTMVWRICLAAGLGLVIGLDREMHGRAAGLRTCMLVAMSGALLMSLSLYLAQLFSGPADGSVVRLDPSRLPSYAIAGMGFLGAGAIIQGKLRSRGITTAAAMWACTGVGLAVGAGMYVPAAAATVLTVLALTVLRKIARALPHQQHVSLTVDANHADAEPMVRELLQRYGAQIAFVGRERCNESDSQSLNFTLVIYSGSRWPQMLAELEKINGVACYTWQESEVP
ncbi:MAG: MgtC/SapB family protein [Thermodesulfobacteriota bacterium]